MFETPAQFLDREHHPGQRRIERRGDAGGAAGEQEMRGLARIAEAEPAPEHVHQAGADMHGRPFTPDRGAAEQGQRGQHQLAGGHAQRQVGLAEGVVGLLQRGDDLRDAAAAGGAQHAVGQPGEQREHARREQQCPPWRVRDDALEQVEGGVAGLGEYNCDQRHRDRAAPQHRALFPALVREQGAQAMVHARRWRGIGRLHAPIVAWSPRCGTEAGSLHSCPTRGCMQPRSRCVRSCRTRACAICSRHLRATPNGLSAIAHDTPCR